MNQVNDLVFALKDLEEAERLVNTIGVTSLILGMCVGLFLSSWIAFFLTFLVAFCMAFHKISLIARAIIVPAIWFIVWMRLGSFQYPQLVGFGKIIEIPIAHKIGVEPWQFALTIAIFSLVMHLVIISEFRKIELIINKKMVR